MENDRIPQGYEKIKQGLENAGFIWDDEKSPDGIFEKISSRRQIVVVNGVQQTIKQHLNLAFKYIGDGYVENEDHTRTPLYGFSFYINREHLTDFWVKDFQDLTSYFEH